LIKINNLCFSYANSKKNALSDISLEINDSEFILITGESGCGKSSLCRSINGLIPSFYGGKIIGKVEVENIDVTHSTPDEMSKHVGMVFQDPENQIVKNDVEREIAFGLENKGFSKTIMAKRVEEVLDSIGINHLRDRKISTLSGGEKQKIAIASVLALHPEILILDEPTSELDPKGAEEVLQIIRRLNEELGLTVILVEHRIDRVLNMVDRVIYMKKGRIEFDGNPRSWLKNLNQDIDRIGIPPISRLGVEIKKNDPNIKIPLNIKEGRRFFSNIINENKTVKTKNIERKIDFDDEIIVKTKKLWYKYPDGKTTLRDINLNIRKGEFVALIGRNASGKTTLCKTLNGLIKPTKGKVFIKNNDTRKIPVEKLAKHIGFLFQDPNVHLFTDTVEQEISFMMYNLGFGKKDIKNRLDEIINQFNLNDFKDFYPRSLSSGEKQRVALASIISSKPDILILDEPTRGLDYGLKKNLMKYLNDYKQKGGTIILVSHDIEIIAEFADRVILMSEGKIIADDEKHNVLSKSLHFSPQINRLIQPFSKYGIPANILTTNEIMRALK